MSEIEKSDIGKQYIDLLNQQKFIKEELDYSILEKRKPFLQMLAANGKSGVSVFDLYKKQHVFYSSNLRVLLGYSVPMTCENEHLFFNSKIHPNDAFSLTRNAISLLKLFYRFSSDEKANYKLITEFRMLNASNTYIRVVEQHQVLEFDAHGNLWLSLSIIDISPNQETNEGLKSQLFNFRTGKIVPIQDENTIGNADTTIMLSQREKQILRMVRAGLLSKEISDKLDISVHTVNTHRQRYLEKLGANNSQEAILFASKLGLL